MATSKAEEPDGEYVCTLSDELMLRSEEELNEKPQWRSRDIQALREMVLKKTDLKCRTDDAFLLRFLRAKKFDYDRAYNLILRHYKMKIDKEKSSFFTNLRPSAIRHVLEAGVTSVLPFKDRQSRRIILLRPGKWDPRQCSIDDVFRANFLSLSKVVQSEETQINGVIMLIDLKKFGFSQLKNVKPFYVKRIASMLQDSFPLRFKGLHYLNEPKIFDILFAIMKPFLKEKILNRIHFHGNKFEKLAEYIDPEYLPKEYGGPQPLYSNQDWMDELLQCDSEFDEEAQYGFVSEAELSEGPTIKEEARDCLVGPYRPSDH